MFHFKHGCYYHGNSKPYVVVVGGWYIIPGASIFFFQCYYMHYNLTCNLICNNFSSTKEYVDNI